jgi:hypothetical protein
MSSEPSFAGPVLKTITIRLSRTAGRQPTDARQELVVSALAAALIALNDYAAPAWTVRAVPEGQPWAYDLTPLPDAPVSLEEAWDMIAALRGQPQIAAAEPSFS